MTNLHCDVTNCGNNKQRNCCRPDIMVGGPRASASTQTYCANFMDAKDCSGMPQNAIDHDSPNPSLDVHCEVTKCAYNERRSCNADRIDIRTTEVNGGQVKTECATFENRSGGSGGRNSRQGRERNSGADGGRSSGQGDGLNFKGYPLGGLMDTDPESSASSPNTRGEAPNQYH
ncbi:DUF1540 domain-containing protein [Caproiciproducens sp. NJN-50]|uniref:DUF1540 domain-containing protein n=1 Tax=Acutalibacteraceae TaxID=3082771 RepID=UPI000FFE2003|nr:MULTISPECIES: DUF1540 domain-containing protein [Acutalibacteraceae]QAT50191.1 DUF1540 domain-containing protein [Caproiciproducens sp. NJN-50]